MVRSEIGSDNGHRSDSSESRYREIFNSLDERILILDPGAGEIVDGNDAVVDLFGYSHEELVGLDIESISSDLGAHARDRARDLVRRAATEGPFTVERQAKDREASTFWVEVRLQPLSTGEESRVIATIRDMGEKAKQERDLRSFKTAVENAGHSIFWTDVDGTIEYVNPAFEEITGYEKSEVIGRNPRILQSGEMSPGFYQNLWETILAGDTFEEEIVNQSATGERIVVSQTIAPITGPTGEIERFVAVNSDITERKEREERLEAEKERVEQLHQRLSVMNRILRHDIRSSVNIIKGNAQLADSSDRHLDQALETVIDEADRLQRIAESVRHIEAAIADSDSGVTTIDVATMLRTKVHRFKNDYPEANFEMEIPDSVTVLARDRFDLALEHLLSNTIDHHDRDSPTVEVTVTQSKTDGTVEIVIADDGPGIPEAEMRPLEEGRETPLEHTSGLGLWLTQWITDVSGGSLSFEKNEPRGTTVRIELETPD